MQNTESELETITSNGLTWIDIQKPTRNTIELLGKRYHFHELNLDDCLSKTQVPKVDTYNDHIFIILNFPTVTDRKGIKTLRFSQLAIFVGLNFLVTVHQGDLAPLVEMVQICKQGWRQRKEYMGRSSGYLLHTILDIMVDDLLHILMKIVGNLEDIEDAVFDDKVVVAKEISHLRREIMVLRRAVIPLRRIIAQIIKYVQFFSEEEDLIQYFNDIQDHVNKVIEASEESKETINIYKDAHFVQSTEKSNRILAILTILFTLSIPVTVIASFYGMNINLLGDINHPSTFLSRYITMLLVIIGSIVSASVMAWYFYKLGWWIRLK
jgi:magnesium transporter